MQFALSKSLDRCLGLVNAHDDNINSGCHAQCTLKILKQMIKRRGANADDVNDDCGCQALCTVTISRQMSMRRRANAYDDVNDCSYPALCTVKYQTDV